MPFAAKDFHTFALWLIQQNTDEASLRTAISRPIMPATSLLSSDLCNEAGLQEGLEMIMAVYLLD